MAYTPDFSRNPKGKFNPLLNFISIKGGTDAYLLEDELNELQWIQTEEQAKLIRTMTKSGCLQKSLKSNSNKPGAIHAHLYLIRDENDNIIQPADVITSENELNIATINPFNAVLNGYIARIESNKPEGLTMKFSDPYATGKEREDLVLLEFWYRELRPHDKIPLYGGIENDTIDFNMLDPRIAMQTSNRVQLQWRIRVVPDDPNHQKPHYDTGRTDISLLEINPQGPRQQSIDGYIYQTHSEDNHLFIAGNGMESVLTTDTIDGYIYAIPLFEVDRLNTSGYNPVHNTRGGKMWYDTSSVSDRVSLDGKFANAIYTNDFSDQRYQAYIGTNELDTRYAGLKDFIEYKKDNTTIINNLINENEDLKKQIEFLTAIAL